MLYNLDEALPAIWASVASRCTPTVLFIVINLVIGTIFFSTFLARSSGEPHAGRSLVRTVSAQLPRLKSLNHLFRQRTEEIRAISAMLSPDPELPNPVAENTIEQHEETHLERSVSEKPEKVVKEAVQVKMKKSTSMSTSKLASIEDKVRVVKRPSTTRAASAREGDAGVDAMADDFINRFKQQLKLQRLDSLVRYKEMMNRGK